MALQEICGLIRSLETHAQNSIRCVGSIQRVEEFWGERLWLSFQNVRLVTAAPNPRNTVINASLDMLWVPVTKPIMAHGPGMSVRVSNYP